MLSCMNGLYGWEKGKDCVVFTVIRNPVDQKSVVTGNYHFLSESCTISRMSSETFINSGITFFAYSKISAYTISRPSSSKFNKSLDSFCSNCFKVIVAHTCRFCQVEQEIHRFPSIYPAMRVAIFILHDHYVMVTDNRKEVFILQMGLLFKLTK